MYKDPTEWREGFKRWKETGESPWKAGKRISELLYLNTMEKVAADNWQQWGDESEDAALTRILNSNEYDYKGYYSKYPNGKGNFVDHWTDEFKTVWHPSFSTESRYSGKKSQYNPYGYPGGTWLGEFFNPQWYQQSPHAPGFYKDGYPRLPKFAMGTEGEDNNPNQKRGMARRYPKNRDKDPEAYDAAKQYYQQVEKMKNETADANRVYMEEKAKRNAVAADRYFGSVHRAVDQFGQQAAVQNLSQDVQLAVDQQTQQRKTLFYPYKLMAKSLWELGKVAAASGALYAGATGKYVASDLFLGTGVFQDAVEATHSLTQNDFDDFYKNVAEVGVGALAMYNRKPWMEKDFTGRPSRSYLNKLKLFKFRKGLGLAGDAWTLGQSAIKLLQ